jgi:hypothetical protein
MTRTEREQARTRAKVARLQKVLEETQHALEQAAAQQAADEQETRDKLRYQGGTLLDELGLLQLPEPVLRDIVAEAARLVQARPCQTTALTGAEVG